jgi:hypothetical protein
MTWQTVLLISAVDVLGYILRMQMNPDDSFFQSNIRLLPFSWLFYQSEEK